MNSPPPSAVSPLSASVDVMPWFIAMPSSTSRSWILLEVPRQVLAADVLEHADARDAVELAFDVAIILQTDLDLVFEAGVLHALRREIELVLRQRDAHAPRAELLRRAHHERAPAAADVEQALAGLQLDLGEDVVDLLDLRGGEIFVAVLEVRARVDHVLVEPQLVELVRDIVVVLDGLLVRRLRVIEVASHARELARARHGASRERVADVDDVRQLAFDVDLALHVRLAEIVEARFEQIGQRGCALHVQRDLRRGETARSHVAGHPTAPVVRAGWPWSRTSSTHCASFFSQNM